MNHIKKTVCSALAVVGAIFAQGLDKDLQVSKQGLEHIAKWEGCSLKAYQCSADVWTIFLGHTGGVKEGDIGTVDDAAEAFVEDVIVAQNAVNRYLKRNVTQPQFDMLVSFVFNLGSGNLAKSTLLKKFNASAPTKESCEQFLRWVYVDKKNCNDPKNNCSGIPERRKEENQICQFGYGDSE